MKLIPSAGGIFFAQAVNPLLRFELPFDRYMQLSAGAKAIKAAAARIKVETVLDVGGDGGLALFLPELSVGVLGTTGGASPAIADVAAQSYDAAVATCVIEQIEPRQRGIFIARMAQISRSVCVVTFALPDSSTAQKFVAAVTGDQQVKEHVRLGLPYSATVHRQFEDIGMQCSAFQHTSRALWAGFMALDQANRQAACDLSRYLIEEHADQCSPDPLYETLTACQVSAGGLPK